LYTSYQEIYTGFQRLRDLVSTGRYQNISIEEGRVT
jgi:hypothetical protein